LKERDCVIEQVVAMKRGPICEVDELIATRDVEMDANQQTVQVNVADINTQEDLCAPKLRFWRKKNKGSSYKERAEEAEKKMEELQDRLTEKDRMMEQVVAMIRGPICEVDEMIAARDGDMDTNQQTV